jgi:hypothetical protein
MSNPTQGPILAVWRGNAFTQTYRWKDSAGAGIDLTGKTVKLYVSFTTPATTYEATNGSGITLADQTASATRGMATLVIPKDTILSWPQKGGRYELELDDVTQFYGNVTVGGWVTNNT